MLLNYTSAWRKTCRHHIWKTPSENAPRHPTFFIIGSSSACSRKRGKGSNIHKPSHLPLYCAFIQWLIWLTHSILLYRLNHHNLKHLLVLLFVLRGKTSSFIKIMNRVNEQIPPGADCSHGPCPSHPITATRTGGRRWHHCSKFTVTTGQTPAWSSNEQQGNGWEFLIAFRVLISEENILLTPTAQTLHLISQISCMWNWN